MRHILPILLTLLLPLLATAQTPDQVADNEVLYQVSSLDLLKAGYYQGEVPMSELLAHGGFGIGTLEGLDGEVIVLNGQPYVVRPDGVPTPVPLDGLAPFAMVTDFEADLTVQFQNLKDYDQLKSFIAAMVPQKNAIFAVRVDGDFGTVTARSVPKQTPPYPPLLQVLKEQTEFHLTNVSGTLVGYMMPDYAGGMNQPGLHMHFLTDGRDAGGHVLDLSSGTGTVSFDLTPDFRMHLPAAHNR